MSPDPKEMPAHLGRYEIVRELGKGAMGVVYEGRDPNLGRRVAIKTARKDVMEASGMADEMMERFLREARSTGVLDHPNIITIFDAGTEGDISYLAMEYLEGGNLRDRLDRHGVLEPAEVAEIGATVCDALTAAHSQGIVHRDIKPANIMTPVGKPIKLTDFGIAHIADSNLTQDGALVGTPHYMSPEQFMGQKLDGRSDLFSVGVMLYELLTGEKPFAGEALTTVMHNVMKSQPSPPAERNRLVNDNLSRVILKSMSKRPQDRYPSGKAMAAALREALRTKPDLFILGFVEVPGNPEPPTGAGGRGDFDGTHATLISVAGPNSEIAAARAQMQLGDDEGTVDLTPPKPAPAREPEVTEAQPPHPDRINAGQSKRGWVVAGFAVVLLLLIGGAWVMSTRSAGGAPDGPVTSVPVEAHYTTDPGVWMAFSEMSDPAEKAQYLDEMKAAGLVIPLEGGLVEAFDNDSGEELARQSISKSGEGEQLLRVPGEHDSVRFRVSGKLNGVEVSDEFVLRTTEQWSRRQVFLVYD